MSGMSGQLDEGYSDEEGNPSFSGSRPVAPTVGQAAAAQAGFGTFSGAASGSQPNSSGSNGVAPDIIMDEQDQDMELALRLSREDGDQAGTMYGPGMDGDFLGGGAGAGLADGDGFLQQKEVDLPRQPIEELNFVVENANLDLDTCVGSHTGIIKTQRLQHIAKHCPQLRVDALKMLLKHLTESSLDVTLYTKVHEDLKAALASGLVAEDGDATLPKLDDAWTRDTKARFEGRLEKLDHDLKNYKTNSIKESIRRGHDEIGNHFLSAGDPGSALKNFNKARDYGEGPKERVLALANRLKACVYLQYFPNAMGLIQEMKDNGRWLEQNAALQQRDAKSGDGAAPGVAGGPVHIPTDRRVDVAWNLIKASIALYYMSVEHFREAADLFVTLSPEYCEFPTVLVGRDIAVYGALCAVASYDRKDLREKVVNNKSFKSFLETAPEIRRLVETFYNSQFGDFLKAFNDLKGSLLLDLLLARHVENLYAQARRHGMIEFFRCFASISLQDMAQEFHYTVPELQEELKRLILSGQLKARIDWLNQVLNRDTNNVFMETAQQVQQDVEVMRDNLKFCLIRTSMARHGLGLRSNRPEEQPVSQ